ncbi:MAG: ferritin-like domain-containing protein [Anaplasmataceae bacterium]|nr:ferritin-like domain-containing protein [Anaplasmataceae bacterium]
MKNNEIIIEHLNNILCAELFAVNNYLISSKLLKSRGIYKLSNQQRANSMDEMKHADAMMDRIIFLGGNPKCAFRDYSGQTDINIDKTTSIKTIIENDISSEMSAVEYISNAINEIENLGDKITSELLIGILKDEDNHLQWLQEQLACINNIGLDLYIVYSQNND